MTWIGNILIKSLYKKWKRQTNKFIRFLHAWTTFLNNEITLCRLNNRVWTTNNHFAIFHMSSLIRQQGPLRYYSCRSLERTIRKYSNLSKSKSMPEKETDNILGRLNYFKELHSQQLYDSMLPSSLSANDDFLDYPGDYADNMPHLWSKFKVEDIEVGVDLFGVPLNKFVLTLRRYYNRCTIRVASSDIKEIKLAARMLSNGLVYQSRYYRSYKTLLKRANALVIFLAVESGQ